MSAKVVFINGGTGFIGRALCAALLKESCGRVKYSNNEKSSSRMDNEYEIYVQTRMPSHHRHRQIKFVASYLDLPEHVKPDVIVNLAGEPIADRRWTPAQKKRLFDSRVRLTENLLRAVKQRQHSPNVLVNASAVGYYGVSQAAELSEVDVSGQGFAPELCAAWEAAANQFATLGTRVCIIRIGVVLGRGGGALGKMLPLFRMGLGGPIAGGKQWLSWVHLCDLVHLFVTAMENDEYQGVFNGTAPNPVPQIEFARALGRALNRPACIPTPGIALKLAFGQMAQELLIGGQKVLPIRALQRAFAFEYPEIDEALIDVVGNKN